MGKSDIKTRVRSRALHVWGAQQQNAVLLQRAKDGIDYPEQRVLGYVLNHVRHVDEVILFRALTEKVADIALDFVQIDAARHPISDVRFVRNAEIGARDI
jgi:hypothetical protein